MSEADRLIYLIYGLMFSEESRFEYDVYNSFEVLKRNPKDSYLIAKYLATVQRYEDFKIFQSKVILILLLNQIVLSRYLLVNLLFFLHNSQFRTPFFVVFLDYTMSHI